MCNKLEISILVNMKSKFQFLIIEIFYSKIGNSNFYFKSEFLILINSDFSTKQKSEISYKNHMHVKSPQIPYFDIFINQSPYLKKRSTIGCHTFFFFYVTDFCSISNKMTPFVFVNLCAFFF